MNKKYLNIKEVSKLLNIKEHVIRYWDSKDPKTNQFRIEGISIRSKGGTRYFNKDNIIKLQKIRDILFENGESNYSLNLANKIINLKKNHKFPIKNRSLSDDNLDGQKLKKMNVILNKMRTIIKK